MARFKSDADGVLKFLEFINSLRQSIKFTLEFESESVLNFLDVSIDRKKEEVSFAVFRKPTHTNRYLNRASCHPRGVFRGIVGSLALRARRVCSAGELNRELAGVERILEGNGYRDEEVRLVRRLKVGDGKKREEVHRWPLPYYPGLSEKVARILRKVGKDTSLRPPRKLGGMLMRKRSPQDSLVLGSVYKVECSDCNWKYVGETSRTLKERMVEHRRAVREHKETSEIASHVTDTGHRMDWTGALVLEREKEYFKRGCKESWWTAFYGSGNRTRWTLSEAWSDLIC